MPLQYGIVIQILCKTKITILLILIIILLQEEITIKGLSSKSQALFGGHKIIGKWKQHHIIKLNTRDAKFSTIKIKSTTMYPHCKKMEYWKSNCFKNKNKATTNIATITHTSKKSKST